MSFELPRLPYDFSALEPYIDTRTMEIHHSKHHAAYTNNLNAALEKHPELSSKTIEELLGDLDAVPADIRTAVTNHGGGYFAHSLFWTIMGPKSGGEPQGDLAKALGDAFGDFSAFKDMFSKAAATQFGSGWAWLNAAPGGKLTVNSTSNQDSPISKGLTPILTVDVWEHAYYLKYQNRRPEWIENWWNTVNWDEVARRYDAAK